jgi:hypothetical protein
MVAVHRRNSQISSTTTYPMKLPSFDLSRLLGAGTLSVICLLAFPSASEAKGPPPWAHGRGKASTSHQSSQRGHDSPAPRVYSSHPRSGFTLSFGTGYAGSGYYYGPPSSPYYYQRPDVRFYSTRELVPREYLGQAGYSSRDVASAVQRELARRGFYRGYVDGLLGPQSRRAIYGYQESRGLQPTGTITPSLLRSLGL